MTTEQEPNGTAPRGLRALVYAALPPGASPTDTAAHPIPRSALEKAQGDVVELTSKKMSDQLGEVPHVVIVLNDGDLDPRTDGDVLRVLEQTDGGVVVFGVTYALDEPPRDIHESCPECGAARAFKISDAPVLLECRECGAVWDV